MINNDFESLSTEGKLKKYNEFNDPSNMFTKNVDLMNFVDTSTDEMENAIQNKMLLDQQFTEEIPPIKSDGMLNTLQQSMRTTYNPIPTDTNPLPYLKKPLLNLGKYATDKTAQTVIKEIDNSNYDAADKKYLKYLGARESDFRMHAGKGQYKGLYQFNKDSLSAVGIKMQDYLNDTAIQHQAALKYRDKNLQALKSYQKYIGTVKDGVLVTKNGIGAMAHLLGAGTVKDYFDGTKKTKLAQNGFVDGNGTTIQEYLKLFA